MAIKVRTESAVTGTSEHVVDADSLRAAGVDPLENDPRLIRIRELRDFLLWMQEQELPTLDVFHESDLFEMAAEYVDREKA